MKQQILAPIGAFLEILRLRDPYKITSFLSNAITFLKKIENNRMQKLMSIWVIIDTFKSDDVVRKPKNAILAFWRRLQLMTSK